MPKKDKSITKKYVEILEKFGLLPNFDFTKKEKKVVKTLAETGDMDILALGDACELKPDKIRKVCDRLVQKSAVIIEDDIVRLSPLALRYLHAKKSIRKSAKKFYRFVDALSESEQEEFMKLVYSFQVVPAAEQQTEPAPEEPDQAPAEEKTEAPEPVEEKKEVKPAPVRKPRRVPVRKKPAAKQPK